MRRLQRLSARLIVALLLLTQVACDRKVPSEPPHTVPREASTSPTSEASGSPVTRSRWNIAAGVRGLGEDVAIQTDGKIVVAGWSPTKGDADFLVLRYEPDGTLDGTFGDGGQVRTDLGSRNDMAFGIAVQPDGAIVVAGVTGAGPGEGPAFGVVRYTSDGTLDTTFGTDGIVKTNFTAGKDSAAAVSVQGDGAIVVAGTVHPGDFAVARYTTDGSLDTSFSGDGRATVDFGGSHDVAKGLGIQADGKIVVSGSTNRNVAVARWSTDGELDRTFSGDGKAITDTGGGWASGGGGLAVQGDGKIVVAGTAHLRFLLVRYTPDGDLDRTFGEGGLAGIPLMHFVPHVPNYYAVFGTDVVVQPDGRIVEAGWAGDPGSGYCCYLALARVGRDGTVDRTFGGDGRVSFHIGGLDYTVAVALQTNRTIVLVGYTGSGSWNALPDVLVTRVLPSGQPVPAK